jgi:hypothetical protein
VAEHVLSYLGVADLYEGALVCRQWWAIIAALPAWTGAPPPNDIFAFRTAPFD